MRKTPEEREQLKEILAEKNKMAKLAEVDDQIKTGRFIIFVIAGLNVLSAFIEYSLLDQDPLIFAIYAPIITAFIVFGIFYFRNPLAFSIAALAVYAFLIILGGMLDPLSIRKGIIVKILVIMGLIKTIRSARDYKKRQSKSFDDVLDQDF